MPFETYASYFRRSIVSLALFLFLVANVIAQPTGKKTAAPHFKKNIITNDFISEGVAVADINNDGKLDIFAGAYWFEAPSWKQHEITTAKHYAPATEFSNSFLDFTLDVNQDGWMDEVRVSLPGEEAVWYENPGKKAGHWKMYALLSNAGNESPAFVDVDGDGRADLLCNDPIAKEMIWLQSPTVKGDTNWQRHVIAKGDIGTGRYTHGLGLIDMNADGRKDVVITKGWWECPQDPKQPNWIFHPADLGEDCSQLYQLDVRGNGGFDLVSSSAHNYGVWWHERIKDEKGNIAWQHHTIDSSISECHALTLADINDDGHPDLITGKRYFAHNGKDPGALDPSVLYWFEFKPGKDPAWIPHQVDDNSGVGLQVLVQDINKDGLTDIVVSNKKGVFFFQGIK